MQSSEFLATEKTLVMTHNTAVDQPLVDVIDSVVMNSYTEQPNSYENTLNLPNESILKDQPKTAKHVEPRKIKDPYTHFKYEKNK